MQEINMEITEKYGIDIRNVVPFKDCFIINSNMGKKVLKKTELPPERIMFIHEIKEHLVSNNFKNIDRYLCTLEGDPFITVGDTRYFITDAMEGRECNFDIKADTVKASAMLGALHKASKGFYPTDQCKPKDDLGKLPGYFNKRLEEIKKLKKMAKKGKSRFDYLFLDYVDYFYDTGEKAIDALVSSQYRTLVEKVRKEGGFCHHDYTHCNIIFDGNSVGVINFEFSCLELKIYDIANLIRRKMRKCNWNVLEAKTILDEYRKVEAISEEEFYVMGIILQFPQKFWRVANKYYNSRRSWSEKSYVAKLQEVIDEIQYHKPFMERYEELI